jgi:hypothetical protein
MSQDNGDTRPVWWALVFVPQGYNANVLFPYFADSQTSGSLYEPNQFVMGCGYIDPNAGPIRVTSKVSRNLQSGDSIALIIGNSETPSTTYRGVVSYAVAYK